MQISLIAALSSNRVIGINNQLPWHLPLDLAHFKALTLNKPMIMGRRTFDSLGRPLPHRTNIVLTRQSDISLPAGVFQAHSWEAAFALAEQHVPNTEIMVIGGANIYEQCLPKAHRLYLTEVEGVFDGDAFFPEFDRKVWHEMSCEEHAPDEKHAYAYRFMTWERK